MFFDKTIKGISELKNEIKNEIKKELKEEFDKEIKYICRKMVISLFSKKEDEELCGNIFGNIFYVKTIRRELKECISKRMQDEINKMDDHINDLCRKRASLVVSGEEFIDSVIDRINRKQIKSK